MSATPAQEITITRTILTSPAEVYAAFTSAQGWCAWCCETAEADARLGGKLHIYTDGYNAYGEFTKLEPDKLLAFTWNGDKEQPTHIEVLLDTKENNTLLTFRVTGLGSEQEWAGFAGSLEHIWGHALDNLKDVLETNR